MKKVLIVISILAVWLAVRRLLEAAEDAELDAIAIRRYEQRRDYPDERRYTLEDMDAFFEDKRHGRD